LARVQRNGFVSDMTFSDRMDTLKTLHNRTIQIGCVNVIVVVNCWGLCQNGRVVFLVDTNFFQW